MALTACSPVPQNGQLVSESAYPTMLTQKGYSIASGTISVRGNNYYYDTFTADITRMKNITVTGTFAVVGDGEIDVLILNEDEFINWCESGTAITIYDSEQCAGADIEVRIRNSGTYYLVFNNKVIAAPMRQIKANVTLNWSELQAG